MAELKKGSEDFQLRWLNLIDAAEQPSNLGCSQVQSEAREIFS
jgi:hypothetical protein